MSRKRYKINRGTGVHLVTHSSQTEKFRYAQYVNLED